jgi:hypothetical protein
MCVLYRVCGVGGAGRAATGWGLGGIGWWHAIADLSVACEARGSSVTCVAMLMHLLTMLTPPPGC